MSSLSDLVESCKLSTNNFSAGNIRNAFSAWEELTSDREILQTVSGLKVDLCDLDEALPKPFQSRLSGSQAEIVSNEIAKLVSKGVLVEVKHCAGEVISPIFLRPKADGGHRMILNLKRLNLNVENQHFKMETISTILKLIQKGAFMAKIDIKDAYYSVPIRKEDQKFFRFSFGSKLYQYTALPNGFAPGPRKFTKLLKPPLAKLRKLLVLVAAYIDDLITADLSLPQCIDNVIKLVALLRKLGFYINVEKSIFFPAQILEYLGFIIDSLNMTIQLTPKKECSIAALCKEALHSHKLTIRDISRLLGKMTSAMIAVRYSKMHYRNLERCKLAALEDSFHDYDAPCALDCLAKQDISWWLENVKGSKCSFALSNPRHIITSDASDFGWGAVFERWSTGGTFSFQEFFEHINIKELKACMFGLQCFCQHLKNCHIKLLMDNTSAVQAVNKMGSMKSIELDDLAKQLWQWAIAKDILLTASHIPGRFNVEADEESRKGDQSPEWMLNPQVYRDVISKLKFNPKIDLFASRLNFQLKPFVSFRPDPEASHVDAFSLNWRDLKFYAFPPFPCIPLCIQKIHQDKAEGIIIAPNWPNQIWYTELCRIAISDPILIYPREDLLLLPSNLKEVHPIWERLPLIGVLVSGKH